jgi:hypothetical protein
MTVQMALRSLDRPSVPAQLTTRLRVTASHELARRQAHRTVATWLHSIYSRVQLTFDNLMRPLAFPFAGGIVSAMMIFGLLVPSLTFQHAFADQALFTYPDGEVVVIDPNGDFTAVPDSINAPRIQRADAMSPEAANVVELTIDASGRVSDWTVARGELTTDLTNIIMFGQFSPATNLGVPIPSKLKAFQIRNIQTAPIRVRS